MKPPGPRRTTLTIEPATGPRLRGTYGSFAAAKRAWLLMLWSKQRRLSRPVRGIFQITQDDGSVVERVIEHVNDLGDCKKPQWWWGRG